MLSNQSFVKQSLDINLFFLRILKEHALFIEASLPSKNAILAEQSRMFNRTFENLLNEAVNISYGIVSPSDAIVTKYTYDAEKATSFLTGIPINTNITQAEIYLNHPYSQVPTNPMIVDYVYNLNNRAIQAAENIVKFKTFILENVLSCRLFTSNYPLLMEHITREAAFYVDLLMKLQTRTTLDVLKDAVKQEAFWNQIMAEHSKFMRGLLDPLEETLFDIANKFGYEFDELTADALQAADEISMLPKVTQDSKEAAKRLKDFKSQGTEGLIACNIKSIILPLLADHVLREANHYLILLSEYEEKI